ncbi:MAG TPA: response regulator [Terriglobales bacterium]|jgi:CheY-like chemotaxis protein|nr:response regulator [Terriglobales bacterium]
MKQDIQRPVTILLVEDNEFVRAVTEQILMNAGFKVLCGQSGDEALNVSRGYDGKIDLVLTDIVLPGMSGPELGSELRRERPEIKVLLTSGYADVEPREQAIPNLEFYLAKPFSVATLMEKIREVLSVGSKSVGACASGT